VVEGDAVPGSFSEMDNVGKQAAVTETEQEGELWYAGLACQLVMNDEK